MWIIYAYRFDVRGLSVRSPIVDHLIGRYVYDDLLTTPYAGFIMVDPQDMNIVRYICRC